jgi:hypothetical protein
MSWRRRKAISTIKFQIICIVLLNHWTSTSLRTIILIIWFFISFHDHSLLLFNLILLAKVFILMKFCVTTSSFILIYTSIHWVQVDIIVVFDFLITCYLIIESRGQVTWHKAVHSKLITWGVGVLSSPKRSSIVLSFKLSIHALVFWIWQLKFVILVEILSCWDVSGYRTISWWIW